MSFISKSSAWRRGRTQRRGRSDWKDWDRSVRQGGL